MRRVCEREGGGRKGMMSSMQSRRKIRQYEKWKRGTRGNIERRGGASGGMVRLTSHE